MERVLVSHISKSIGGKMCGPDNYIDNITTDSRKISSNAMFIAIKGENVDGNDFATGFLADGGACAVVERDIDVPCGKTIIRVEDTKKAIRDIAEYYKSTLDTETIAVTGSVGKTSTKDMLGSVISQGFKTLITNGNFNNEIGVPLTVFRLDKTYEKAVIEMGMSNAGEIDRLSKIVKPNIAVITNIGTAHIGNLGSRENILKAKLEILEYMSSKGLAVLNGDDNLLYGVKNKLGCNVIYFGIENKQCDYFAYDIKSNESGSTFCVNINGKEHCFNINVAGRHHIYNAMAAIICGLRLGMDTELVKKGVSAFSPSGMRQKEIEISGIKIIEDCYNASTDSMKSSLLMLKDMSCTQRKIAVLGDMLEQGAFAEQNHRLVGKYVCEAGIDTLVSVGDAARYIADEIKKHSDMEVYCFDTNEQAGAFICDYAKKGDIILFKASRGMKLEEISDYIQQALKGRLQI